MMRRKLRLLARRIDAHATYVVAQSPRPRTNADTIEVAHRYNFEELI